MGEQRQKIKERWRVGSGLGEGLRANHPPWQRQQSIRMISRKKKAAKNEGYERFHEEIY